MLSKGESKDERRERQTEGNKSKSVCVYVWGEESSLEGKQGGGKAGSNNGISVSSLEAFSSFGRNYNICSIVFHIPWYLEMKITLKQLCSLLLEVGENSG